MQQLDLSKQKLDRGYCYVYDPQHPLANAAGKVYVHRYVISLHLGRWLHSEEHVHHIDENRSNNKIENLEVVSSSRHAKEHFKKYPTAYCIQCNKPLKAWNGKHCSYSCLKESYKDKVDISKEELEDLIWEVPYTKVATLLGISDNGVKKRAIALGCILPPPRFHVRSKQVREKIRKELRGHGV